jgi:hypothetical protein
LTEVKQEQLYCGIIMPIAAMSGYTAEHWAEVKSIIIQASEQVDGYEFNAEIVSNSDGEIDVIHKRIIQNIYNADIVVCDISGRNPNVLFELGMRLTFDKPTILIKDDQTDFIFDTGVIEHLTYPKDLRFNKVVQFKSELANRIKLTYEKSLSDPDFSTFLRNFGTFKVPSLDQTTVSDVNQLILEEMSVLRKEMTIVKKEIASTKTHRKPVRLNYLKDIIYKYVDGTKDFEPPEFIVNKQEFRSFLISHDLNISELQYDTVISILKNAHEDILPF